MSEYGLFWAVRSEGHTVIYERISDAFEDFKACRKCEMRVYLFPKIMLIGKFRRGLKESSGR